MDEAVRITMGGFRAQQDDDGMRGHPMVSEEQRVVRQQIGMLPGGGARLEIEVNDCLVPVLSKCP